MKALPASSPSPRRKESCDLYSLASTTDNFLPPVARSETVYILFAAFQTVIEVGKLLQVAYPVERSSLYIARTLRFRAVPS